MRRIILIGSALLAGLALAGMPAASSASEPATPEELPSIEAERSSTGANIGNFVFKGILEFTCTEASNLSSRPAGTAPLGLFHIHLKNCTTLGGLTKCTGLDELTAGVILILGTWHLWWDREKGKSFTGLTTATVFLNEPVHFSCAGQLIVLRGVEVCLDLNPTTSSTTHEIHCIASGTAQTEEYCEKEKGGTCEGAGWIVPKLESSSNGGEFKESAWLSLGTVIETSEVFADV